MSAITSSEWENVSAMGVHNSFSHLSPLLFIDKLSVLNSIYTIKAGASHIFL